MSASKWSYTPEKCNGEYCPGDCDVCSKAYDDLDLEMESEYGIENIPEGRCEISDLSSLLRLL